MLPPGNNPLGFSSNVRANQIISNVSIHSLLSFLYFSLFSHSIFLLLTAALQCTVSMLATSQQLPALHWKRMLADLLDNPAHFVFTLAHLARRWPEGNFPLLWPGPRLTNITTEELSFLANVVSRDTATSGENQRTPTRLRCITFKSCGDGYHIHESRVEVFTGRIFSPISNPPRKLGSKSIPPQIKKLGHPTQSMSK